MYPFRSIHAYELKVLLGQAPRFRFGLYRHDQLVELRSLPIRSTIGPSRTVSDCPAIEGAELGRLVLLDDVPGNGESWFVAECLRRLRRVGLAGVVSFSDPVPRASLTGVTVTPGHIGTVYQALNAAYLGRSSPRTLRLLADGTILSDRTLQKLRSGEPGTRAIRLSLGISDGDLTREALDEILQTSTRPLKHPGNHRYAWALATAARRALPRSLPYPKWLPLWRLQLENQGGGAA